MCVKADEYQGTTVYGYQKEPIDLGDIYIIVKGIASP